MSKLKVSHRHGGALKLHRIDTFGEVSLSRHRKICLGKSSTYDNGTDLAINYLTLGVAAHLPRRTRRGGARNCRDRESEALTGPQIGNLLGAAQHATAIGMPFTRMITIHWQAAGVPLSEMAGATGHFIDLLSKALARHGSRTTWLWVHENGEGKGGHCHVLAHVPAELVAVLTNCQRGWLRSITRKPYRAGVIFSRPIGGRLGLETGNPDLHAINLEAALSYVLKGACEAAASKFKIERMEPGGRVIGKRCGTSQNIGAKARKQGHPHDQKEDGRFANPQERTQPAAHRPARG